MSPPRRARELHRALARGGVGVAFTGHMFVHPRGEAGFVSLARPPIREPDLVARFAEGSKTLPDCVSCNICLMHDEHHSLRCWRTPRRRLVEHAIYRLEGGFRAGGSGKKPQAEH